MKRIYFFYIFFIALTSCDFDDVEVFIENEPCYNTPYENTSTFVKYYSNVSNSTIKIGSQDFIIPQYQVFPKDNDFRPFFNWPIVKYTNKETVLVVCTNLQLFGSNGEMDILLARKVRDSNDWEIKKIFQTDSTKGRAMCPALVIDNTTERIYLIANYFKNIDNNADEHSKDDVSFVYKYSDDDGLTWSREYSLKYCWDSFCYQLQKEFGLFNNTFGISDNSSFFWNNKDKSFVNNYTANDNIICLPSGNGISINNGLLLVPSCVIINGVWHSTLLIRENGKWHFSKPTPNPGDGECTVYVDSYNRIVLDCRTESTKRNKYYYNISNDKYTEAPSSITGSYVRVYAEIVQDEGLYYMCFPDSPNNERKNLTFWGSKDGVNWTKLFLVNPSEASSYGYSSIASYDNKLIICFDSPGGIIVRDISSCRDLIRKCIINQ